MHSRRNFMCVTAMAAAATVAGPLLAQPAARVGRILVGAPAGSQLDLVARQLADKLRTAAGQAYIVENRPGATGRIAIQQLKSADADGSTIMLAPSGWLTTVPHMRRNNPYDPLSDLTPIGKVCSFDFALALGPATPANSLQEFIRWTKANPGLANISVPIGGGTLELLAWMLARSMGQELPVIAYKGGGGQFRADLIAGRVPAAVHSLSEFLVDHRAGKLRVVATMGSARSAHLADVPTFAELGMPDLSTREWFGLFAPPRAPAAVVQKLADALQVSLRSPDDLGVLARMGLDLDLVSGAAFRDEIRSDYRRWRDVVRSVGYEPIE